MEKVFKLLFNSMLTVFLLGIMVLPIASLGTMGIKPQDTPEQTEVLSIQDTKETTESEIMESETQDLIYFEEIDY